METRLCRICWNSHGWQKPDGTAQEGAGYHTKNGFGHEEWLFRYEWMLSGYDEPNNKYKYGFLQPVQGLRSSYASTAMQILIYTRVDNIAFALIGMITPLKIIDDDEALWASRKILKNGWLTEMRRELKVIGANTSALPLKIWDPAASKIKPWHIVNVRFAPSDVIRFQPSIELSGLFDLKQINRYSPYHNKIDQVLSLIEHSSPNNGENQKFDADKTDDLRESARGDIYIRRGQQEFRRKLLQAYKNRCAVSGCDATEVLEAAHILPYRNPDMNHVQNGLLLRSDIHTLFDLDLLSIDPKSFTVSLDPSLKGTVVWDEPWVGQRITLPENEDEWPSMEALMHRVNL